MFTLMLITAAVLQTPDASSAPTKGSRAPTNAQKSKTKSDVAAATPEQAWRTFMVAILTSDRIALRAITLPNEDFEWLLMGEAPPPDQVEAIKAQIAHMPIRTLKPGDKITLPPRNQTFTIKKTDVTKDRAMIQPDGDPLPHRLQRVDGRWRVDASPIIAARKAIDSARKKASNAGR